MNNKDPVENLQTINTLINEIKEALRHRLLYAAVLLSLMLPDVCAALESADGQSTLARYKAWYNTWLSKKYLTVFDADDMYRSVAPSCIREGLSIRE